MPNVKTQNENKFLMIIKAAMNVPGVQIKRTEFLRKELSNHFSQDTVALAIEKNPAYAGININELDKIAKSCINYETNQVSLISAAAGIPGGIAMLGTMPADTVQYFAHIIRVIQKLMYLYGWQELYNDNNDTNSFDDETLNKITLFIGVMFGVASADTAIAKIAKSAAMQVEKKLADKALTKGMIYPVVKKIAEILGVKMTKEVFAKSVSKIVPVIGGMVSGGLTYITFKPSAKRLQDQLKSLSPANVNFYKNAHANDDFIDVEFDTE